MNPNDIQKHILRQIEETIKPQRLAVALSETLNISQGAAYRRINGETLITFEQFTVLIQHYNISIDTLTDSSTVRFHLPSFKKPPKNIFEYMSQTEQNLLGLVQSPTSFLRFAALEMPFHYFLSFPHLAAFKFYIWGRTLWQSDRGRFAKFNFEEYTKDAPLQALIKRIIALNNQIPAEEIWNDFTLDITFKQIHYCYNSGLFEHNEDVKILLGDMKMLIEQLEIVAKTGRKTMDNTAAPVQIWQNELFQNPMLIMTETPEQKLLYYNVDVPYFMVSNNLEMYEVGLNFFNRIKNTSTDITSTNELNRYNYFLKLHQKWADYEKELKYKTISVKALTLLV